MSADSGCAILLSVWGQSTTQGLVTVLFLAVALTKGSRPGALNLSGLELITFTQYQLHQPIQ